MKVLRWIYKDATKTEKILQEYVNTGITMIKVDGTDMPMQNYKWVDIPTEDIYIDSEDKEIEA